MATQCNQLLVLDIEEVGLNPSRGINIQRLVCVFLRWSIYIPEEFFHLSGNVRSGTLGLESNFIHRKLDGDAYVQTS